MIIDPAGALLSAPPAAAPALAPPSAAADFATVLSRGLTGTDATVRAAENAVESFALGGGQPPHQVMMALEEARMSLHFALQVRSRLVEGYQELMRMQL